MLDAEGTRSQKPKMRSLISAAAMAEAVSATASVREYPRTMACLAASLSTKKMLAWSSKTSAQRRIDT